MQDTAVQIEMRLLPGEAERVWQALCEHRLALRTEREKEGEKGGERGTESTGNDSAETFDPKTISDAAIARAWTGEVHEGGFRVTRDDGGELRFFRPDGAPIPEVAPLPPSISADNVASRLASGGSACMRRRRGPIAALFIFRDIELRPGRPIASLDSGNHTSGRFFGS